MDIDDASRCLHTPLREGTDLFEFNISHIKVALETPVYERVPLMKPAGEVTLKYCPWWVSGQHQLGQLYIPVWMQATVPQTTQRMTQVHPCLSSLCPSPAKTPSLKPRLALGKEEAPPPE